MSAAPELRAALLGAVQGVAELLPVSSSAHVAALPGLLGWELADWPPERRKELEVALHAGATVALAPALLRGRADLRTLALANLPPVLAGYLLEDAIQRRLGGPRALAAGLLAGAAALALADRAPQRRGWIRATPRAAETADGRRLALAPPSAADALALGLAQAAALAPGVSRTGATLAAARARGYTREDASALSFGVAGPVLVGASALKAFRGARRAATSAEWRAHAVGAGSAFVATAVSLRLLGLQRRRPLWPYAAERALLAAAIVRYRRTA